MLTAVLVAGTLVVLVLAVLLLLRVTARLDGLRADVERVRTVHRDMATDLRNRVEEGERRVEAVGDARSRLEQLETSVADHDAALQENLPTLVEARRRLEEVEQRVAEAERRMAEALEAHGGTDDEDRWERLEAAVRTLRNAADVRLTELTRRVTALEEAPPEAAAAGAGARGEAGRGTGDAPRAAAGRWVLLALAAAGGLALLLLV